MNKIAYLRGYLLKQASGASVVDDIASAASKGPSISEAAKSAMLLPGYERLVKDNATVEQLKQLLETVNNHALTEQANVVNNRLTSWPALAAMGGAGLAGAGVGAGTTYALS